MAFSLRSSLPLVLGLLMVAIGGYIALRPLLGGGPVTPSRWLDLAFAAFFVIRGLMNVRLARRLAARRTASDDVAGR